MKKIITLIYLAFTISLHAQIVVDKSFNMKNAKTGEIQKQIVFVKGEVNAYEINNI